jgi:alcohol dehydrogenase class IV
MSISFQLARIPQILFGPGKIHLLGKELLKFGKNVLIVTGKGSFSKSTQAIELFDSLSKSGIISKFISVENEPSVTIIDSICKKYYSEKIDVVVGIGGGSVLDAAKALSAMLKMTGSIKDFLEGVGTKIHSGEKIPYIAVPTTSGTGSETTSNTVISEIGVDGFKKSLRHPNFVPDVAIVDPELTLSCSPSLTGATGLDAFTQLLESYLSTKASSMTDLYAFEGIKHSKAGLKRAYDDGNDLEARSSLAYASMLSGITLTNAGLGTVHGFASSIGAYFHIPHGVVCGTLMAVCNEFTINKLRKEDSSNIALFKYAEVGKLFSKMKRKSNNFYIDFLIETLKALTDFLSIPKLGSYGIIESDFAKIIASTDNKNNPIALSDNELEEILNLRL